MPTLLSSDLQGLKLGFDEMISNISPTKTPFTDITKSKSITTKNYQHQVDAYADVDLTNRRAEGADAVVDNGGPTTVVTQNVQHLDAAVQVSDIADIISKYGRKKELTYRVLKKGAELKRTLEAIMLSGQATDGTTTTPALGSFQSQVHANHRIATGDPAVAPTEDLILSTLETLYTEGADPSVIMVTPNFSIDFANFAKAAGRYREIQNGTKADRTIVNAVNLYVSPFNEQKVILNRWNRSTDQMLFDPADWTRLVLVPWKVKELSTQGRSEKVMIYGSYGLMHENPKASAVIRQATGTNGKF